MSTVTPEPVVTTASAPVTSHDVHPSPAPDLSCVVLATIPPDGRAEYVSAEMARLREENAYLRQQLDQCTSIENAFKVTCREERDALQRKLQEAHDKAEQSSHQLIALQRSHDYSWSRLGEVRRLAKSREPLSDDRIKELDSVTVEYVQQLVLDWLASQKAVESLRSLADSQRKAIAAASSPEPGPEATIVNVAVAAYRRLKGATSVQTADAVELDGESYWLQLANLGRWDAIKVKDGKPDPIDVQMLAQLDRDVARERESVGPQRATPASPARVQSESRRAANDIEQAEPGKGDCHAASDAS